MSNKASKGSNFEREICKKLSLWAAEGKRDDIFWRTSQSGGRATQRRKFGIDTVNSCGDISLLDNHFKLGKILMDKILIELKRGYSSMDVLDLLDKSANKLVLSWYSKARREADESGRKYVWIIFRRNRRNSVILVEKKFYLEVMGKSLIEKIVFNDFYFFRFDDLLSKYKLKEWVNKIKRIYD